MRYLFVIVSLLLLTTGCSNNIVTQNENPFLFSYELNKVEPKHAKEINPWLQTARNEAEVKIHSYETKDGYKYSYVKGYKDVEVTYIYSNFEGKLKQRFIKGSNDDEILVEVNYNKLICCNTNIYETDDNNLNN
ncbi:hypothetical protein NV379_22920 [Paenibacillus sp. N1-5-1-14]|uniref:hypothetical protein n=1 Tax=Paenibacillus radicibacter TaxID=2972488 RepID=UPI002158E9FB|nr:hypothetical protein [Paenibacillus radicibacter]MCR8645494.1 hypothetical protein [Paenibacillus radicibacter]